ncbi:MAG: peptidyl-prolyl cis-trans isomerase [Candidatus Cloacimonetes bacterium]|nr:peptidyl-prolyl cis-trans isomerase [Candidatus Cloacimonadota bacterium]
MKFLIIVIAFGLFFTGCDKVEEEKYQFSGEIVARVNDDVLRLDELKSNFNGRSWFLVKKDEKREFVKQWIDLTVLAQAGTLNALDKEPLIVSRLKSAEKNIMANATIAREMAKIQLSEEALFNYYRTHESTFKKVTEQLKIQQIVVDNAVTLEEVLNALRNGAKFSDTARQYSKGEGADAGGYIGFKSREQIPVAIWDKLQTLRQWGYTQVQIENNYYIVRWYEKQTVEKTGEFNQIKKQIEKMLIEERQSEIYQSLLKKLKQNADIEMTI